MVPLMVQRGARQVDGGCSSVGQELWVREGRGEGRSDHVALVHVLWEISLERRRQSLVMSPSPTLFD